MHHQLVTKSAMRRALLVLGLVGLFVAAMMTWQFGRTMTIAHGLLLVGITLLAGIIFAVREVLVQQRDSIGSKIVLVAGCLFLAIELFSHIGYTVGMRVGAVERSNAQNTRYDDQRGNVKEASAAMAATRERLAKLEAEQPWLTTITAAALRAQLPPMEKAIELETSRGGCKARCKALMERKGELDSKIALAEEVATARASITDNRVALVTMRDKSSTTKIGDNTVKAQTFWVSQLVALSLTPDMETMTAVEVSISLLLALGGVAFAPSCLWMWARLGVQMDNAAMTVPSHVLQRHATAPHPREEATVEVRKIGDGATHPAPHEARQLSPIDIELPINVHAQVDAHGAQVEGGMPLPTRRITRVQTSGFARRVSEITANLRRSA